MAKIRFRHTNKQRGLRGCMTVWGLIFCGACLYIISDLHGFFEHRPFGTIMVLLLMVVFGFELFRRRGKEQRKNAVVSDTSIIVGETNRYLLEDLALDIYQSESSGSYYHLYNKGKDFTLYTAHEDDLIKLLLSRELDTHRYHMVDYRFKQANDSVVYILAGGGRRLSFNLDSGSFVIQESEDTEPVRYNPVNFIQTPKFRKVG